MTRRGLCRDTRGGTAVEFAVVGVMLCLVTFGIIETALMWWVKSGMQAIASQTARCGAIGYTYGANNVANFSCTDATTTKNYAVNTAAPPWGLTIGTWGLTAIAATDITLNGTNGRVTNCNGLAGNYFSVSVSHTLTSMPPPLGNYGALSANACYPMP